MIMISRKAENLWPLASKLMWIPPPRAAHLAKVELRQTEFNPSRKAAPSLVAHRPSVNSPSHPPSCRQLDCNHAYPQGRPQGDPRGMKNPPVAARKDPIERNSKRCQRRNINTKNFSPRYQNTDFVAISTNISNFCLAAFGGGIWLIDM